MRVACVVQARMTSARLPGKVLMEALGKPLLEYELERLGKIPLIDELIVATTTNKTDDPVAELCGRLGVSVYRGSEHDVLSRYLGAAELYNAGAVVRVSGDCPLLDPEISNSVISYYLEQAGEIDYCAVDVESYPRGTDTEICSPQALREADMEGTTPRDREHVTFFIWNRPERYKLWLKRCGSDWGKYRFTVDTPEDFALIREIIERLYPANPDFSLADVIKLLEDNPDLFKINEMVSQKIS